MPVGSPAALGPTLPSASLSQLEGNNGSTFPQPADTTSPSQFGPVFTNSTPLTSSVQRGSASGLPLGWDPVTGFGMPLGLFTPLTQGQTNTSASQPIVQNVSAFQPTDQTNMSASQPMAQQQQNASLIQPITPTEVLTSRLLHRNGVNWVFHDPMMGTVRHVNVPYAHPLAQQSIS